MRRNFSVKENIRLYSFREIKKSVFLLFFHVLGVVSCWYSIFCTFKLIFTVGMNYDMMFHVTAGVSYIATSIYLTTSLTCPNVEKKKTDI